MSSNPVQVAVKETWISYGAVQQEQGWKELEAVPTEHMSRGWTYVDSDKVNGTYNKMEDTEGNSTESIKTFPPVFR